MTNLLPPYRRLLPATLAGLLSVAAWALVPGDAVAPAITVSAAAAGQQAAVVARAANGQFVVVWRGDDGDQGGIFARLYDDQGRPLTAEFAVNTTTISMQAAPAVAMNPAGSFVVVWASRLEATAYSSEILARRFTASGSAITAELAVNAETVGEQSQPAVGMADNGDFVVAWNTFTGGDASNDLFARRFSADGAARTASDQAVNQTTDNSQQDPAVSLAPDGSGLIAWTSFGQDGGGAGVFARSIGSDGLMAGSEQVLNAMGSSLLETRPALALAADGSLCAAWQAPTPPGDPVQQIYLRRFNASGAALGDPLQISTGSDSKSNARIAASAHGDCAVVYGSGDGSGAAAQYLRLIDRNQLPLTEQLTGSSSAQPGSVASDADGDLVQSYIETSGVKARRHVGPEPVDLTTALSADQSIVVPGGVVRFSASVSNLHATGSGFAETVNTGIGRADGVTLLVPTPAGSSRSNLQADSNWDCAASTDAQLICTRRQALIPGSTASLGFDLTLPASTGTVTVAGGVAGLQSDPGSANNAATQAVVVRNPTYQFVALSGSDAKLVESSGEVTLKVTVSPPSGSTLRIPVTVGGTAGSSDYSLSSGETLVIPAGAGEASVTVTGASDSIDEDDETLVLTLGQADGAETGTPLSQTLTIVDDDASPTLAFSSARQSFTEGNGGLEAVVRLSNPSHREVQLAFTTSGSASADSDYTIAASTSLIIPAGQTEVRLPIGVVDDLLDEDGEEVRIALVNPQNATLGSPALFTLAINDNDAPPTIGFAAISGSLREGAAASNLSLRLSSPSAKTVSGNLVASGTASADVDYQLSAAQFSIPAGSSTVTLSLAALADHIDEPTETLTLNLGGLGNASASSTAAQAQYELIDSNLPSARFASAAETASEGAGTVQVLVQLSSPADRDLSLPFTVSGETGGDDVFVSESPLRIPAGDSGGIISLSLADDRLDEDDERLILTLDTASGVTLASPTTHLLTISDDDAAPSLRLSVSSLDLIEGQSGSVQARLSSASSRTVQATLALASGTAGSGDFSLSSTTLRFAPGATTASVQLQAVVDTLTEGEETLLLQLQDPVNTEVGSPSRINVSLRDVETTPDSGTGTGTGTGDGLLNGGTGGNGGGGAFGLSGLLPLWFMHRRRQQRKG